MKAMIIQMNQHQTMQQHMTSIEIADISGEQHQKVMKIIKEMELAWEKMRGSRFVMEQYKDEKGRLRYCYSLTKVECFFVAAGFNEEVTIKMALRWNQLDYEFSEFVLPQLRGLDDEDVLERADDIIAEELEELNQQCKYCYTSTEIAKPYGLNANDLLSFLSDKGIVQKMNGHYELTRKYRDEGLARFRYSVRYNSRGKRKTRSTLVWTEAGRQFINEMIG